MTPDERTLLLLAAEALRVATLKADKAKHLHILADALDRIAGAGEQPAPDRFTPYSGRCWRCGTEDMRGAARMCRVCWSHFPKEPSKYEDAKIRAWIEDEEKGKP